jgi:hypothetical protein
MFSGKIPQGEWYDLHVPVGVTFALTDLVALVKELLRFTTRRLTGESSSWRVLRPPRVFLSDGMHTYIL